jgi:hypothetical protein
MDIVEANLRQLAPTVGSLGVGVMSSTAFSPTSRSNSMFDGSHIFSGTVDFQPHPPTLILVFANLDQDMDITIRSQVNNLVYKQLSYTNGLSVLHMLCK